MRRIDRTIWMSLLIVCVVLVVWYASATYIFVLLIGGSGEDDWYAAMLWDYYRDYPKHVIRVFGAPVPVRGLVLASVFAPPASIIAIVCFIHFRIRRIPMRRRRAPFARIPTASERAVTDNHGHAEWMTIDRAKQIFNGPKYSYGGKLVGQTAKGDLLFDTCELRNGLSLEFATSGGGKTSMAAARCAYWRGPMVVTDPKAELGPMLYEAKQREGYRVVMLNPNPKPSDNAGRIYPWASCSGSVNVVDWIDPKHPLAEMHVHTAVNWMFDPSEKQIKTNTGDFFHLSGRDLVACLLAHVLWSIPEVNDATGEVVLPPPKTLATVRRILSQGPDAVIVVLHGIKASSRSHMARDLAGEIVGTEQAKEMWPGIFKEAAQKTSWLTIPAFAALVSGDTIRSTDIVSKKLAVFIQVPLDAVTTMPPVVKVLMACFLNAMIVADGDVPQGRVHFEIDESKLFGRMTALDHLRQYGRGYRVSMHMNWLSVADMEEVWDVTGRRSWFECATWRSYTEIRDHLVAREISDSSGRHGVMAQNESFNRSVAAGTGFGGRVSRGENVGTHEISKNLIDPYQLLADLHPRQQLILGLEKPLKELYRVRPWERAELIDRVMPSRFYREMEDIDAV